MQKPYRSPLQRHRTKNWWVHHKCFPMHLRLSGKNLVAISQLGIIFIASHFSSVYSKWHRETEMHYVSLQLLLHTWPGPPWKWMSLDLLDLLGPRHPWTWTSLDLHHSSPVIKWRRLNNLSVLSKRGNSVWVIYSLYRFIFIPIHQHSTRITTILINCPSQISASVDYTNSYMNFDLKSARQ